MAAKFAESWLAESLVMAQNCQQSQDYGKSQVVPIDLGTSQGRTQRTGGFSSLKKPPQLCANFIGVITELHSIKPKGAKSKAGSRFRAIVFLVLKKDYEWCIYYARQRQSNKARLQNMGER